MQFAERGLDWQKNLQGTISGVFTEPLILESTIDWYTSPNGN